MGEFSPAERAGIAQAVAAGKVTRIEQGEWRDALQNTYRQWLAGGSASARGAANRRLNGQLKAQDRRRAG